MTIHYAIKTRAALVEEWWRSEVRVSRVDRGAARQQLMRGRRAAIILQWAKHRIGVDLITWTGEETASIIVAEIVAERRNRTCIIKDVSCRPAGLEDSICYINHRLSKPSEVVDAAAYTLSRVSVQCAIAELQSCVAALQPCCVHDAGAVEGRIATDCAVTDVQMSVASNPGVIDRSARRDNCRVAAQSAVVHVQRRSALTLPVIVDTPAGLKSCIVGNCAIIDC